MITSDQKFPIKHQSYGEVINSNDEKSYFYELVPTDFDQLTRTQIDSFLNEIRTYILNQKEKNWIKVYRLGDKIYLNSISKQNEESVFGKLIMVSNPMEEFFQVKKFKSITGFFDDYIKLNSKYLRLVSVVEFDVDENDESFLNGFGDYVVCFVRKDQKLSKKQIEGIRNKHYQNAGKAKTDFNAEEAYSESQDAIHALERGVTSEFKVSLCFLIRADDLSELNEKTEELTDKLELRGIKTLVEGNRILSLKVGLNSIFCSLIPGAAPRFDRLPAIFASFLVNIIPLHGERLMKEGVMFHTQNDFEVKYDFLSKRLKNRNAILVGASGEGKSALANTIINELTGRARFIVVEKGWSYKRNCMYNGGTFLSKGIDPLIYQNDYSFIKNFIMGFVDTDKYNKEKEGLLYLQIEKLLSLRKYEKFMDLICDLDKAFPDMSAYFGEYRHLLVSDQSLEVDYLYVSISEFPADFMVPLVTFITKHTSVLVEENKSKGNFEAVGLFLDDCLQDMKHCYEKIDDYMRRIRKEGGFVGLSTQTPDDLPADLWTNAYTKIFFSVFSGDKKDLCEFDLERISSLKGKKGDSASHNDFSEFYIKTFNREYRKRLRLHLSPLEFELFQSEKDLDGLDRFLNDKLEYFPAYSLAVEAYVREVHGG